MDEDTRGPAVHDGYAITSLVLGLLWLGGVGSVLAVVFGAMSEVNAHRQGRKASGLALAGQLLGAAGIVALIVILKHR
jgi:Domain of unknown function (DUF4190)